MAVQQPLFLEYIQYIQYKHDLCQGIRVSGNLILPGEPLAKGYYKWHPEMFMFILYGHVRTVCSMRILRMNSLNYCREGMHCSET